MPPSPSAVPTTGILNRAAHEPVVRAGGDLLASAESLSEWVKTEARFPKPGDEYLGFHIERELGRGAFGRVYLARQGDLAGRAVALKVACDVGGESQTLAQMQHTNIVPVYSFHRDGPLQAVCMPYYGRTTLADVVGSLRDRASLPSSGRELRSTIAQCGDHTVPSAGSAPSGVDPGLTPGVLPTLPERPVLSADAHDGWARLEGLSFVEAVLCLAQQLADGLAHAHNRGILHRDLKPANVLLTDEGRPMLLDFNLAEDTKARDGAERAAVGGTLPYMAPEQMRAFRDKSGALDGRCDIYALGVVLFELLTGRHPFPSRRSLGRPPISALLADREQPPPAARAFNRSISPAVDAIVRKCLAPDAVDRYQRAEHLSEDIDRHLNNRPLRFAPNPSVRERVRKWARRNPRLASSGTVGALATVLLVSLGASFAYSWDRSRDDRARAVFADHRAEFADAQLFLDDRNQSRPRLDEADTKLRAVLARYDVPDDAEAWAASDKVGRLPDADRTRLRGDVGETFYLMAQVAYLRAMGSDNPPARSENLDRAAKWNEVAARFAGDRLPHAVREQRAAITDLRGNRAEAETLRADTGTAPPDSARDLYLLGAVLTQQGRHREALPHLRKSTHLDPKNFSAWFVRGTVHLALDHDADAVACFTACLALRDDFAPAWRNRGLALARSRAFKDARDDFTRAIALDPVPAEVYVQRAVIHEVEGNLEEAEADLSRALEAGGAPVHIRLLRASVRQRRNNLPGAQTDREEGLRLTPADEASWVARGTERLAGDAKGALADAEEALKINPFSMTALQLKAHILGERLNKPDDALAVLNRAVELHPDHVPTRAGRGVELARRGKRADALKDAHEALLRDTRPANLYQVGCIYALTAKSHPEDKKEALHLLWSALKTGFGLDMVDTDADLDPLRKDPEFTKMVAAARARLAAAKHD
ncbi:protein kinase [Gemmata sp. G18]|uniref:non-specific serine/threonine protein kinase n=1 Tax=Gemmata palustris TaxID=2822762 RepID=A0ABS5BQB9_9BACT|nr:serine/threonine-protein kinase [Gemmata palustris]MBP3955860.1 protein kinase [Gemmata palustris]